MGLLLITFIAIPIGIGLFLYFVPKSMGHQKTSKYLTATYFIVITSIAIFTIFEDNFFSEKDAHKLVNEQGIELTDKIELVDNESMSAIGDYYHTFSLKISNKDKNRIIKTIKASNNFLKFGMPIPDLYFQFQNIGRGKKRTQNYETEKSFVREFIVGNGPNLAPTYRRIMISKEEDLLIFEDIDY